MREIILELTYLPVKLTLIWMAFVLVLFKRKLPRWLDKRMEKVTEEPIIGVPEKYFR